MGQEVFVAPPARACRGAVGTGGTLPLLFAMVVWENILPPNADAEVEDDDRDEDEGEVDLY